MIKKSEKSKLGDAPVVHPCIFQEDSMHLSLGMPKASPSSSTTYQVTSSETTFLFRHILCALLGASVCFYFCFCLNKFGS